MAICFIQVHFANSIKHQSNHAYTNKPSNIETRSDQKKRYIESS